MIVFKTLSFVNLCSYGDAAFEFDFEEARCTAFTGVNGSGKSTILDALAFVLYGKPWRKITKAKLVNNLNKRALKAEILFTAGTTAYRVVRGIKPDIFEIWADGKLINQDAKSRDYQKVLEDDILRLSWSAFNQVTVVGKATYTPFMQLDTPARRAFVESVLGLQVFSQMKALLTVDNAAAQRELAAAEASLGATTPQLARAKQSLVSFESMRDDASVPTVEAAEASVEANKQAIQAAEVEVGTAKSALDEAERGIAPLDQAVSEAVDVVSTIRTFIADRQREADKASRQLSGLDTRTSCPTCGGPIDASTAVKHAEEIKKSRDAFLLECAGAKPDLDEALVLHESKQEAAAGARRALQPLRDQLESAKQQVSTAKSALAVSTSVLAQSKKRALEVDALIQGALKEIQEVQSQITSREEECTTSQELVKVLGTVATMLKDSGVKATILRRYIPVINSIVNGLLSDMGFFAKFEMDEEFNDKILSRGFEEMTYNSFSEGEKLRVDMAVMLAWRELCILNGSSATNLLVFDEILDGSFDQQGLDALLEALKERDDLNMIVITHHADRMDAHIDRTVAFKKVDGYSRMESAQ